MSMALYYGCVGSPGHFMHRPGGRRDWDANTPWGRTPDGTLLAKNEKQIEGRAVIHHKDGWTALSFWDRSVDHRGGSNSNFFIADDLTFDQMLERAKAAFPEVFARFKFDVALATNPEPKP